MAEDPDQLVLKGLKLQRDGQDMPCPWQKPFAVPGAMGSMELRRTICGPRCPLLTVNLLTVIVGCANPPVVHKMLIEKEAPPRGN